MSTVRECKVYERIALSGPPGGLIRPGGTALTDRALSLCDFRPGSRLLDVGCGTGATVKHLITQRGFWASGIDLSRTMLEQGKPGSLAVPLIQASGERIPFRDEQWDGVLAECSLSLARDATQVLRECWRVLKDGGKLIVSDVYIRNEEALPDLRALGLECCLTRAFSLEELLGAFEQTGFVVVNWEDHSQALKEFAAQLILSGESAQSFWCSMSNATPHDGARIEEAVARARPGYFLAIAERVRADACA